MGGGVCVAAVCFSVKKGLTLLRCHFSPLISHSSPLAPIPCGVHRGWVACMAVSALPVVPQSRGTFCLYACPTRTVPPPPPPFVQVCLDVCDGLRFCHEGCGGTFDGVVVHRDIKPENILLRRDVATGEAVAALGDFGISKVYQAGDRATTTTLMGTPGCVPFCSSTRVHTHSHTHTVCVAAPAYSHTHSHTHGALPL